MPTESWLNLSNGLGLGLSVDLDLDLELDLELDLNRNMVSKSCSEVGKVKTNLVLQPGYVASCVDKDVDVNVRVDVFVLDNDVWMLCARRRCTRDRLSLVSGDVRLFS
jgi:hypothetical protein